MIARMDAGDFEEMISLVIPVFNEEENLSALMDRIRPVMSALKRPWEIILVDDGSRDRSLEILKGFTVHPEVRVVELTRNYGQHAAILAGFSIVRGDIVVTLDADLQNPPEEIPRLIDAMEEGGLRRGRHDPQRAERIPFSGSFPPGSSIWWRGKSPASG